MPRELMHWAVLNAAVKQLNSTPSKVLSCIQSEFEVALLGAVVHDAPYYRSWGSSPFEIVGNAIHGLHGKGVAPVILDLINSVSAAPSADEERVGWALIAGMCSHMVADQLFHPWVYYFTGNYFDADREAQLIARTKHRELEVYLDSWVRQDLAEHVLAPTLLQVCSALRGSKLDAVVRILSTGIRPSTLTVTDGMCDFNREWELSIWDMSWAQRVCVSKMLGLPIKFLARMLPRLRQFEALTSFGRTDVGFLREQFKYRNPVSGEEIVTTLNELFLKAVQRFSTVLELLEQIRNGADSTALVAAIEGSLNYGVPFVGPEDGKYFSALELPL